MHMDIHLMNGKVVKVSDWPEDHAAELLALQEAWIEGLPGILSVTATDGTEVDVWWYDVVSVVLS
jgi:hypothetical protein